MQLFFRDVKLSKSYFDKYQYYVYFLENIKNIFYFVQFITKFLSKQKLQRSFASESCFIQRDDYSSFFFLRSAKPKRPKTIARITKIPASFCFSPVCGNSCLPLFSSVSAEAALAGALVEAYVSAKSGAKRSYEDKC